MAHEQLTPLNKRSKEEQLRIQSKGGLTVTPKQRYAAKMREIAKKLKFKPGDVEFIVEQAVDPDVSLMAMDKALKNAEKVLDPKDYIKLMNDIHKSRYGTKVYSRNENLNVDVKVNLSPEETEAEIARLLE